ncbi:ketopantoate reductase family protein [Hydrogenophaga sp.]|uniref:ketopantoate reductase family protein n=1 Tax=Hydrogenophaga sp. TaxID=1904254 RepID=UPI0026153B4B|nr:2-dehydropantoate 2-reductase [Hydrogenophaga sp.]MDM7950669.1 2-dehydropantoate 2-reductase [Hydrogenophaga sp.]
MKILILGAGGIGGYFGAHLIRAGANVTYLVRDKRKALIDAQGLRVETPQGAFVVQPQTVTAQDIQPEYDLILLAPKSYDLDDALHSLKGALGQGIVLPFLNGRDHLDKLDALLGQERVMGGVAHIAATITPDGAIRQLTDMHRLTVGARHPSHQEVASDFIELCRKAPFDSLLADDIEQVLWDKWVFLATLAGMTTLCRGSVGDIVATPYGQATTVQMYEECCRVAHASGRAISAAASAKALEMLTATGSSFTASMLRDLLDGQNTEHDHILGAMIRRGQSLTCSTPLLGVAHTNMAIHAVRLVSKT